MKKASSCSNLHNEILQRLFFVAFLKIIKKKGLLHSKRDGEQGKQTKDNSWLSSKAAVTSAAARCH